MPKLKKAPKNSYYFFITKRLERAKAEGYVIWGGFQEASRTFGFEWGLLSKEERAPYEQMAKEAKEQDKYDVNNKFTTTGETYATVFQQQLERNTAQQQMESFIERMTSGPEAGNRVYIFMKCVHSVEMLKDKRSQTYMPAELSMAAFTLKGGMERIYTTLIDTQEVPMGYASSARENAEDSLLPLPGDNSYTEETRDYGEILKKIFGFANHFQKAEGGYDMPGHYRVFFCREAEIAPISTGLQWLVDQLTDFQREKYQYLLDTVKVYSFNKLIIGMAQEAHKVNTSYSNAVVLNKVLAESIILKGNYEYRPEIACLFHSSKRGSMKMQNCAQSIVMRRIFMLFDEFVPAYKYKWTERHDISNVGKGFQHTMIKEKREEKPVEEVVINEIPDWLRDEPKEKPKARSPSPSVKETCTSSWLDSEPESRSAGEPDEAKSPDDDEDDGLSAWTKASAPTSTFVEEDFPSLGGDSSRASSEGTARWGSRGRGRGLETATNPMEFDFETFPSLGSTSAGRGRGRGSRN